MSPQRIQLRRTKGWRKPDGAVVVARPSKWGNPYRWRDRPSTTWPMGCEEPIHLSPAERRRQAVLDFESMLFYGGGMDGYPTRDEVRTELAGRDLACWCPLKDSNGNRAPCHADVLLKIANPTATSTTSDTPDTAEETS